MAMMIGKVARNEFHMETDPYTGVRVERLTDPAHTCCHIYPAPAASSADGKFLLYLREVNYRRQLFALNLETGLAIQLTGTLEGDAAFAAFTADDRHIVYLQQNKVWRLDACDLLRESIYDPGKDWYVTWLDQSADDRYLLTVEVVAESRELIEYGSDWDRFVSGCQAAPRCRIVRTDVRAGTSLVMLDQHCWLARAMLRPGDPDTVLYCHEGPRELIDARIWTVRADGQEPQCCREQPSDLLITSEFWLPDGSAIGYLAREMEGERRASIRAVSYPSLDERVLSDCAISADCTVDPTGRYVVCSGQDLSVPIHIMGPSGTSIVRELGLDDNEFLHLIDLQEGRQMRLCHHGSSWSTSHGTVRDAAPHPVFTRDGHNVLFVSDREGQPAIYRVDVARFLWECGGDEQGGELRPGLHVLSAFPAPLLCAPAALQPVTQRPHAARSRVIYHFTANGRILRYGTGFNRYLACWELEWPESLHIMDGVPKALQPPKRGTHHG